MFNILGCGNCALANGFQKKLNQPQTMDAYSRIYGTLGNTFVDRFFL
jgi:hypothetical protein